MQNSSSDRAEGLCASGLKSVEAGARATRMALFLVGFGFSAWAAFIPFVKMNSGLDEAGLGLLLLFVGVGSMSAMPFVSRVVARLGCRRTIVGAALIYCMVLPLLASFSSPPVLAVCLSVMGAALGATEVTANIQGVHVQNMAGRPMMSGFHAFYSVGAISGAGFAVCCLSLGFSPFVAALLCLIPFPPALLLFARGLLGPQPRREEKEKRRRRLFSMPKGVVVALGLLLMFMFMAESVVGNWGALLLAGFKGFAPEQASLGFAVFSGAIVLGRIWGDKLTMRLGGSARTIVAASAVSSAVYVLCLHLLSGFWVLPGFALLGLCMAPLAPCLFSLSAKQKSMPPDAAISAVTAFGYGCALFTSPLIGMLARHSNLPTALSVCPLVLVGVAVSTALLIRRVPEFSAHRNNPAPEQ